MFTKRLITLDIDDECIRLVTSKIKKGNIEVLSSEDIKIKNIKSISTSIKEYLSLNKIKIKNVACTTQNENIIFRNIEIPYIKKESDIIDVLKFQLGQYMPVNLEKYILQYKIQNIVDYGTVKNMNLNVVLFPKNISSFYKTLIKDMGLKPCLLDTVSNSINKLYISNFLNIIKGQSFMTVEIRDKYVCVNIFVEDILKISTILERYYDIVEKIIEIHKYSNYKVEKMYIYGENDDFIRSELSKSFNIENLEL
ncbi:MAG TPA: hypothetical protein VLM81_02650, partial [Peptostreptococcaceae bacterium]|nr:hypothetical protein [Peptostreptococcaceae bacterium]